MFQSIEICHSMDHQLDKLSNWKTILAQLERAS